MGMWDKDKEMGRRLDAVYSIGDYLVIFDVAPHGTMGTKIGEARKTRVIAAPVSDPTDKAEVFTLSSAIADKAELATPEDFPIVAQLLHVPTDKGNPALVLQYVRDFDGTIPESGSAEQAASHAGAESPY